MMTDISVKKQGGLIPNLILTSLVPLGIYDTEYINSNQQSVKNVLYQATSNQGRSSQVLELGEQFNYLVSENRSIGPGLATDPILLSYLQVLTGQNQTIQIQTSTNQPSVAGTYASRRLAYELIKDTNIVFTIPRGLFLRENANYGQIPYGRTLKITNNIITENLDTNEFFCYGAKISHDRNGTIMAASLCNTNTITSLWDNN
mgnify:CR=1 FL=1